MKVLCAIDDWLLGNDEGTIGERIFYYGTYIICIAITIGIGANFVW